MRVEQQQLEKERSQSAKTSDRQDKTDHRVYFTSALTLGPNQQHILSQLQASSQSSAPVSTQDSSQVTAVVPAGQEPSPQQPQQEISTGESTPSAPVPHSYDGLNKSGLVLPSGTGANAEVSIQSNSELLTNPVVFHDNYQHHDESGAIDIQSEINNSKTSDTPPLMNITEEQRPEKQQKTTNKTSLFISPALDQRPAVQRRNNSD